MKGDEVGAARACRELARISPPIAACMEMTHTNIWASDDEPDSAESLTLTAEQEKEHRWTFFQGEVRYFVEKEGGGEQGIAACLRAVSEAIASQPGLFK